MHTYKARVTYTANGTQKVFSIPFDYLRPLFIKVYFNETLMSYGNDYLVANREVRFAVAPPSGAIFEIHRITDTVPLVAWYDASVLRSSDMTLAQTQNLHIVEELEDWIIVSGQDTIDKAKASALAAKASETSAKDSADKAKASEIAAKASETSATNQADRAQDIAASLEALPGITGVATTEDALAGESDTRVMTPLKSKLVIKKYNDITEGKVTLLEDNKANKTNLSMPDSSKILQLNITTSGQAYTAPVDGWAYCRSTTGVAGQWMVLIVDNKFAVSNSNLNIGGDIYSMIPVKRNSVVSFDFAGAGLEFYFISAMSAE